VDEDQKSAAVRFFEWWAQFFARLIVLRVFLLLMVLPTYYLLRWYKQDRETNCGAVYHELDYRTDLLFLD
jgi:hypothetical protein